MENTNNKIVTVSFMLAGILLGLVTFVLVDTLAALTTGGLSRTLSQDIVRHGLPVVVGLGAFIFLNVHKGVRSWSDDVATEIRKIVWPSRKDTFAMTIVVCVMVLISGVALGMLDILSGSIIDWLLTRNPLAMLS